MVDKNSPDYLKSELKTKCYGNESSTTYEKELKLEGNDAGVVESASWHLKRV